MDHEERPFNPADHRNAGRVRAFLRGEIIHSKGASRTECTVRDLSEGGARLEAPASVTVPEFFELYIPLKGQRHRARIMWRAGNELGAAFIVEAPKPDAAAEALATQHETKHDLEVSIKLLELEVETKRLRAQLAAMQETVDQLVKDRGVA